MNTALIRLEAAAATDCGLVRKRNEDAYYKGAHVFAVADGMGGHLGGDVASATALPPIMRLEGRHSLDTAAARQTLREAFMASNAAVLDRASEDFSLRGMGTTLTAIIIDGCRLHLGHIGDSRAYLVRDGQLCQLTRDHTLVAEMVREGMLTTEEASIHPQRSVLTQAVGVRADVDVDTRTIELTNGDQILLCSDGLTEAVNEDEILGAVIGNEDVGKATEQLVQIAIKNGGPDNTTVVLVRYKNAPTAVSSECR
jgi:protein phosphatase